jgi:hypothetical protein
MRKIRNFLGCALPGIIPAAILGFVVRVPSPWMGASARVASGDESGRKCISAKPLLDDTALVFAGYGVGAPAGDAPRGRDHPSPVAEAAMGDRLQSMRDSLLAKWGPMATYVGSVESLPLHAQFESTRITRGAGNRLIEQMASGAIYRDSAGRVRWEFHIGGKNLQGFELVFITDFAARTVVALDTDEKTATRFVDMGPAPGHEVPVTGWAYSGSWSLGASPEERRIEGVICKKAQPVPRHLASAEESKIVGEIWVSDEIKYSVLEKVSEGELQHTWRLFNIQRAEPPHTLFVVPDGYTEVVRSKFDAPP